MNTSSNSLAHLIRLLLAELMKAPKAASAHHPYLSEDPAILHEAFYEIKKRYAAVFPALDDLHFITAGSHPYSPELTELFDRLQAAGAISRENPSFERFTKKTYEDTSDRMQMAHARIVADDDTRERALKAIVTELEAKILHAA